MVHEVSIDSSWGLVVLLPAKPDMLPGFVGLVSTPRGDFEHNKVRVEKFHI